MKKIFYPIIFVFLLVACEKDSKFINYEKIELKPFILENYYRDAKQLYFNEVFNDSSHPNFNNPELGQNEIEEILKIIQAVYNSDSPARDSVFEKHQIHTYLCYGFSGISLKVKPQKPWIENLSMGIIPTGEPQLDQILNTYNFDSVKTSYSYPDFPWLTIFTPDEYNMIPVENEFETVESILIAEFNKACVGDGNNIRLERSDSSAIITFSIGSGDCPAGCIYHKYWEFKVTDGTAKFIRSYED